MKIAFYYPDEGLPNFDYATPYLGNPGVGGTHYCILLLIYYLRKFKPEYDITVYCYTDSNFPSGVNKKTIKSFNQALDFCSINNHDFFIMRHESDIRIFNYIKQSNAKVIFWGHNYYLSDLANNIVKNNNIVANVFVGKQQYDRYIDHPVCKKSTVIYNMITDPIPVCNRYNDSQTVVYMGALIPSKGFLQLAKLWKSILKQVPNAKLKVIGTGAVYSRNVILGELGVADKQFENKFFSYLSDTNGNLLASVEFLGLLGIDKYDVFKKASVGVINPSARTETFGMGIVEMASAKLPVVTLNANGFPDTIENKKTGFLCNTQKEISEKIILLLKDNSLNEKFGDATKLRIQQFSPDVIVPQWVNLFENLFTNQNATPYLNASAPFSNNFKWIRIINRFLRINCHLPTIPMIEIESFIYDSLISLKNVFIKTP